MKWSVGIGYLKSLFTDDYPVSLLMLTIIPISLKVPAKLLECKLVGLSINLEF